MPNGFFVLRWKFWIIISIRTWQGTSISSLSTHHNIELQLIDIPTIAGVFVSGVTVYSSASFGVSTDNLFPSEQLLTATSEFRSSKEAKNRSLGPTPRELRFAQGCYLDPKS
ncbi:hypothetical protein AAHA92_29978 [Salvia divinorum]|uniref:Uncharacterized protein n=1 Tax=Salvia divinorum TaxID=28513 RepID=A0ABD1G138_SALDI